MKILWEAQRHIRREIARLSSLNWLGGNKYRNSQVTIDGEPFDLALGERQAQLRMPVRQFQPKILLQAEV